MMLFREVWRRVILSVDSKTNIRELANKANTPYCHCNNIIKRYIEIGIVQSVKIKGRKWKVIALTKKGKIVQENICKIDEAVK